MSLNSKIWLSEYNLQQKQKQLRKHLSSRTSYIPAETNCKRGVPDAGEIRALSVDLRPLADREAEPPFQASGRGRRDLRQARGLQFRAGFRREQDPQAGIHHP